MPPPRSTGMPFPRTRICRPPCVPATPAFVAADRVADCERTPLNEACLELPPDERVDARLTWLCPPPDRCADWLEFDPRENGFANACEDAGDVPPRDELTDRFVPVADADGRLHQLPNVMIADSSLFVTSSGYGPTLTLAALAARSATALIS